MKPTLCIGDVHGHYDRLRALLLQEGIIDENENRINHDVEVVQLGDLGHFGADNPTGDLFCYDAVAQSNWIDVVLWGNHDYAVFNTRHQYRGFQAPARQTRHTMKELKNRGILRLTHHAHGFFLSHAGLHKSFKYQSDVPVDKTDAQAVSEWLNELFQSGAHSANHAIWDAIGRSRGGKEHVGGILWRDAKEKLYQGFGQVFGHSRGDRVRKYGAVAQDPFYQWSFCIDVGGEQNGRLAGIWLPDKRTVEVTVPQPSGERRFLDLIG